MAGLIDRAFPRQKQHRTAQSDVAFVEARSVLLRVYLWRGLGAGASRGGAVSACHPFASRDPLFSY